MLKYSHFRAETDWGYTVIPLHGPSESVFEKTAAPTLLPEVVSYIAELRPRPGSQYVLVSAMGAGEYYSSNINGDHFPEAALIHKPTEWAGNPLVDKERARTWPYGFPTFYNAYPYAHHRNKDPRRAFGTVELAAWNELMRRVELVTCIEEEKCLLHGGAAVWDKLSNGDFPDVSMGTKVPYDTCFPAGTLIRTTYGHLPIEDVRENAVVTGHTGSTGRVTAIMARQTDEMVTIQARGLPSIRSTPNHPYLVLRRENAKACNGTNKSGRARHTPNEKGYCRRCGSSPELSLEWVVAEDLRPGDYLSTPVVGSFNYEEVEPLKPQWCRILGYYLGDGHIIRQRTGKAKKSDYRDMGAGFTVGREYPEHLQQLLATLSEAGLANESRIYDAGEGRNADIINVYDQELARWLVEHGGRGSKGKYLRERVFDLPVEARLELLGAYLDTDGSYDATKGSARILTTNRGLAYDTQQLLLKMRIPASVGFAGENSGYGKDTKSWHVFIPAAHVHVLAPYSVKIPKEERHRVGSSQTFFSGDHWLCPISSVSVEDVEETVYNLSVDTYESYLAEGRAVHNCSICLDWDEYNKALATYVPGKHKHPGAAVLLYHKAKKKRDGVGIRGLSITRADYCEHAREMMNTILPDGRKVWVYNDFPHFFDISFVFMGADKIAKVMVYLCGGVKPSAVVAEEAGVKEPVKTEGVEKAASTGFKALWDLAKPTVEQKEARARYDRRHGLDRLILKTAFGKVAKPKRAEIAKDVIPSQFAGKAVPLLTQAEPGLPRHMLEALSKVPLGQALSTSTGMGMLLRPQEFQRILLTRMGRREEADELEDRGMVFPRVGACLHPPMGPSLFLGALARLLLPALASRSALAPAIERRMVITVSLSPQKETETPSQPSELLHKIGAAYNGYRTGAISLVTHAPHLMESIGGLEKLSSVSADTVFTPLARSYLLNAYWDEVGTVEETGRRPAWRGDAP